MQDRGWSKLAWITSYELAGLCRNQSARCFRAEAPRASESRMYVCNLFLTAAHERRPRKLAASMYVQGGARTSRARTASARLGEQVETACYAALLLKRSP